MARPGDRRPVITDQAILVLAGGGARALTHQAVDRSLGLAVGSTSYYFRTRRDLVVATIDRIRVHSRTVFAEEALPSEEQRAVPTRDAAAAAMTRQLSLLAGPRRCDALAVFALLPEVESDAELRDQLAAALFSRDRAAELLSALGVAEVDSATTELIDFLNGILFGLLFGQRRSGDAANASIGAALQRFLRSVMPGEEDAP